MENLRGYYRLGAGCGFMVILFGLLLGCRERTTLYAERKDIMETVYASGNILPEDEHGIFSLSNGIVKRKKVNAGDTVTKGSVLYELEVLAAVAGINISSDKVRFIQQFSSPMAEKEKYSIKSDCNGIVYQTMREQGEAVRIGEPVVLIGSISDRVIRLAVDPENIKRIRTGQQVLIRSEVTGDSVFNATIRKVYDMMTESSQSFRVDAYFNETYPVSFVHSPAEANIIIDIKKDALVLPREALVGVDSVWTVKDGKTQKIKVRIGINTLDQVEILGGLQEDTPVILPPKK
jgi:multidrug efflux pump subunit AcrA (membrane-fusion protein)